MESLRIRGVEGGVLYLSGELDLASVETFEQAVKACLDGQGEVVLDLRDVSFLDSTGVHAVLSLASEIGDRAVILRYPRRPVLRVLDLVRIEDHRNISVERD